MVCTELAVVCIAIYDSVLPPNEDDGERMEYALKEERGPGFGLKPHTHACTQAHAYAPEHAD
jgi:hypothetical protein